MSTIAFDLHELGNVAAVVGWNPRREPARCAADVLHAAATLAAYSVLNHRAYAIRYPHAAVGEPWTKTEIARHAPNTPDLFRALRTFQLLEYNLDDLMTPEVAEGLVHIGADLAGLAADYMEAESRR